MTVQVKCRECGLALPPGSPAGLCPKCVLGLALNGPSSPNSADITPLELAESPPPEPAGIDALRENLSDNIPGYRLLEEIGHGGYGIVYMAEQEKPVRRRVALKVIKIGMDTRQVVARFDAERQVLARMDHPNIAKVLDAGETERGRPYFVMELVGGLKITEYCDQYRLKTEDRLRLFVQVCRAIQHAHQKSIIHRDIKPSNVLVAQHDGVGVPKVIDFGIAKATQGKVTDQTLFTSFEQFLGTPVYMSPEQAEPGGLDVDTRSDIYGLGVLLYELLTGKTPFDIKSPNADPETVRRTVREKEPVRPSTRLSILKEDQLTRVAAARQMDALKLVKTIRGDLEWIVMKCLEKDRARRYETANGLAMDIQRYLNQEPVLARPPSPAYRFRKFVSRNQLATFSAVAIAGSLLLGIALSTWLAVKARRAERQQRELRLDAQAARRQATEELWASCLAQARSQRLSRQAGARFDSLAAIAKAAAIRPSIELRNEAIAALAQADIRWVNGKHFGPGTRVLSDSAATYYATCDGNAGVNVYAISNHAKLATLPDVHVPAKGLWLFSPDGNNLAVGYSDKEVRVWDWHHQACILQVPWPDGLDFSPDNKRLGLCVPGEVQLFELRQQNRASTTASKIVELQDGPWALRFHPNGKFLAAYNELHTNVLVLDLDSGKPVMNFGHDDGIRRVAWSPDGRYLASSCLDNFLHLWDTQSGKEVWRVPANQGLSVAFNPQSSLLAVAGWDGRTRLWDFLRGRQLVSIYKSGEIAGFSPDGRLLVETLWDGHGIDAFEVANAEGMRPLYAHESDRRGPSGNAIFSHNGSLLAFPTAQGERLWDNQADKPVGLTGEAETSAIGFDAEDRHLLLTDSRGLLTCALQTSLASTFLGGPEPESQFRFEPPVRVIEKNEGTAGGVSGNGEFCFLVGSNRCEILNTRTFANPILTGVHPGMRFVAANHDGSLLASGAWLSPGVIVWDGRTGEQIKSFQSPGTTSVIFSPDGYYLVTATTERYDFWQVGSWAQVLSIAQPPDNDFVPMMAFSRDGRIFAGTHSRNIVRLHDAVTGEVLADLEPPDPHMVTGLSFNDDGSCLAVCEGAEATRVWDLHVIRSRLAPLGLDWKLAAKATK